MKASIMDKIKSIDAPMDEAETHFENKGRLIGSWALGGITVIFAILLLIFPNWFPLAAVGTAALMVSLLWAAEYFGKFVHSRRPLHLLSGLILSICALSGAWIVIESAMHLASKM